MDRRAVVAAEGGEFSSRGWNVLEVTVVMASCVTSDKLLRLSEPRLLPLENGVQIAPGLQVLFTQIDYSRRSVL